MKSLIKNKSELVELRFCYILLIINFTIFLAVGFTRELWFQILLLPFIRVISLFFKLHKLPHIISKVLQSLLSIFLIVCCWIFSLHFLFSVPIKNDFMFFDVFYGEILLIIIFHRFIFFSKCDFLSRYLLPSYRIFKKFYLDIILVVVCYVIVYYSFLPGDYKSSFDIVGIVEFLFYFDFLWHTIRFYIYLYLIFIGIAGIWYIVGKYLIKHPHNKN